MGQTPNTLTSMNLDLRINAASLRGLLNHVNVNGAIDPVKIMFTAKGATIWAHDANKTLQIFIDDMEMDDYVLEGEDACIVLETKKFSEMLGTKFGKQIVRIKGDHGKPVTVTANGSSLTYYPPSEDECFVVPDHWVLGSNEDGELIFPMFEGATSTLRATLHRDELKKALIDMRVSGATYSCVTFNSSGCISESGHWASKGNHAKTPVEATVVKGEGEVTFPEVLAQVADRLESEIVEIQKHKDAPFFLLVSGSTRILVTEAQRVENE